MQDWIKAAALPIAITITAGTFFPGFAEAKKEKSLSGSNSDTGCRSCLSQATGLFAGQHPNEAIALLRKWSDKCPNNAQLHLLFSTILVRQAGDLDEAEKQAALAVAAKPDLIAARLQYATTLLSGKKYTQASKEFQAVTDLDPSNYEAWSALSDLHKRLREDKQAAAAEAKAAALEPGTQAIRLSVLRNLQRSGKFTQAGKEIKSLLQSNASSPEFNQLLAVEAIRIGAYDQAIEAANRVLKDYPKSSATLQALALAEFLNQEFESAANAADSLLALAPNNADALALKALSLLALNKNQAAESLIEKAQRIEPTSGLLLLSSGSAKLARGDFEQALEALKSCTESDTKSLQSDRLAHALAYLAIAVIYRKQGLFPESIQAVHAASQDKRFEADAAFTLAETMEAAGKPQEALNYYQQSIKLGLKGNRLTTAQTTIARLGAKQSWIEHPFNH